VPAQGALNRLTPIATRATSGLIADQIRELVADGSFTPGSQITEVSLAVALGVSRGPVREAIQRLVQEGLLRNERNRGIFVPVLTREDVEDVYRVRAAIELTAMELLMRRSTDDPFFDGLDLLLDGLQAAFVAHDFAEVSSLDITFHKKIVHACGSVRIARAFETLEVETRMCLNELEFAYPSHPDIADWHRHMVRAMRARDPDLAKKAIEFHNATVLQDLFSSAPKTAADTDTLGAHK
jgi:DNA-binding GntR family transcriptional regulator